ncbi:hypothetical protein DERP_009855 [Dermatophagoides pteronyssinus]|uniref:Uncharacterized protein n=1 Tax=Dermatophagoides pteronyssinus TaxID=6956 RepID=A0ABQ8IRH5_DERPT|nr:hypothetical protein DERP_009855 [Dermatophagoides pteronyssinus]
MSSLKCTKLLILLVFQLNAVWTKPSSDNQTRNSSGSSSSSFPITLDYTNLTTVTNQSTTITTTTTESTSIDITNNPIKELRKRNLLPLYSIIIDKQKYLKQNDNEKSTTTTTTTIKRITSQSIVSIQSSSPSPSTTTSSYSYFWLILIASLIVATILIITIYFAYRNISKDWHFIRNCEDGLLDDNDDFDGDDDDDDYDDYDDDYGDDCNGMGVGVGVAGGGNIIAVEDFDPTNLSCPNSRMKKLKQKQKKQALGAGTTTVRPKRNLDSLMIRKLLSDCLFVRHIVLLSLFPPSIAAGTSLTNMIDELIELLFMNAARNLVDNSE